MKKDRNIRKLERGYLTDKYIYFIPSRWVQKCCSLEGRDTLKVGIALWQLRSWKTGKPQPDIVFINQWFASQFHITPRSLSRALERLREARLIRFVKGGPGTKGQRPVVRLLYLSIHKPKA